MQCDFVRVEQPSEDWVRLRRGRLTASRAGDWLADPSTKRYQDYQQLIAMQLLGFEDEEDEAPWFAHGKAMEPWARDAYKYKTDLDLDNNLFLIHREYDWLGASPDGVWLPDHDGMTEIKCRDKLETYRAKIREQQRTGLIEACYRPQVQCQLWITGFDQLDFVNYYHDQEMMVRKLHIFTVERDEVMIARIEEKAIEFMTKCYEIAALRVPPSLRGVRHEQTPTPSPSP